MISADSHIIEPADLWTSRIDAAYRERGPHIEMQAEMPSGEVEDGQFMVVDGGTPQRVAGFAVANVDPKDRAEANKRGYEQIRPGAWDPVERLKDQDIDGIVCEVIYPSMAMPYFSLPDTGLQQAVFSAYNDWMAEFCSHDPKRLVGLAMISLDEVEHAVSELHRARSLGLRGALIPNSLSPEGVLWRPRVRSGLGRRRRARDAAQHAHPDRPLPLRGSRRRSLAGLVHGPAGAGDEVAHGNGSAAACSRVTPI